MIILIIIAIIITGFLIIAIIKKPESIYKNNPEEMNPMEGKKVRFIADDNEETNADGARGYLEATGEVNLSPGLYERVIKRIADIVLSFFGLVILSPVFLVVTLWIIIDDPGPVLFIQKRVGRNKQYFRLHKFRSMKMSTPNNVPTHMLENPGQYITKAGKFLRLHSLDELPQIWDIFIGNMSVIGPRPALWNQDLLTAERDKYGANDVKPGLTGWAQINGRDELEISVKAKLDGEYVAGMGPGMDIKCFLGSIGVFTKDGSIVEGGTGEMKRKEKTIAVISSHTPSLFWFRLDMMRMFSEKGYKVYALGNEAESKWSDVFEKNNVIYKQISVSRNGTNPIQDIKTIKTAKSKLKEIMPEKIFTYQAKTVIYGTMAANSLGITEVYPLIAGIGSVFISNDIKSRVVKQVMIFLFKMSVRKCPAIFFQNQDDENMFRKYGIIKTQKAVMIHGSGVNIDKFSVMQFPEKTSFLCISRLIRDKGIYEYLEASKMIKDEFPDIRCLLVGPYDTNPSAIKQEELSAFVDSGIEYFGEQDDVRPYIEQASVFILPSYREGTPKTNLEAMACGRAIITTDAPGCRETVVDGDNGFLIPVKDVDALYEKMKWFIKNPQEAKSMGLAGRKKAEEIFDVKKINCDICEAMKL